MKKIKKIILVAGEESGDMYAKNIINNLSKHDHIKFYGMGSTHMHDTKAEIIVNSSELSVIGFIEIFKIYPKLKIALNKMKNSITTIKPDLLVLIDYQEFNMKLARYAKRNGIKVLFYISPQVWAWRENRIKNIKKSVDEMAVIFPFEKNYYNKLGLNATYVGHPLVENNLYKKKYHNNNKYIGFFPGSRLNEVKKHIPIIKSVIEKYHKKYPLEKFLISCSNNINEDFFKKNFPERSYIKFISNKNIYETIDMCKVAVAASGTITLQIALKKIPMCVFYKLSNLTYFIARFLVKIKYISLVNIVLNKNAIKEFIQYNATCDNLVNEIENLTNKKNYISKILEDYDSLEGKLLDDNSKEKIYDLIERLLEKN